MGIGVADARGDIQSGSNTILHMYDRGIPLFRGSYPFSSSPLSLAGLDTFLPQILVDAVGTCSLITHERHSAPRLGARWVAQKLIGLKPDIASSAL